MLNIEKNGLKKHVQGNAGDEIFTFMGRVNWNHVTGDNEYWEAYILDDRISDHTKILLATGLSSETREYYCYDGYLEIIATEEPNPRVYVTFLNVTENYQSRSAWCGSLSGSIVESSYRFEEPDYYITTAIIDTGCSHALAGSSKVILRDVSDTSKDAGGENSIVLPNGKIQTEFRIISDNPPESYVGDNITMTVISSGNIGPDEEGDKDINKEDDPNVTPSTNQPEQPELPPPPIVNGKD